MASKVSLKHYLFTGRGEKGNLPLYFRITYDRKKAELHSGYTCTVKEWNEANQCTKSNNSVNQELSKQKSKIYELLIDLQNHGKPISAAVLKNFYLGKNKVQISILGYLRAYIKELQVRNEIKPISLNKYTQSLNTLLAFILSKYSRTELSIEDVNFDFINSYDLFLKQEYKLHRNTINKYHSRLRTILIRANNEGLINKQPYSNFKLITSKSERSFLSQEDLNKIINLDLSQNLSLDRVRDLFVFSSYTGLRFQDAQNLTTENLTSLENKPLLKYTQKKTEGIVNIPLLPIAKKIIEKYKQADERLVLQMLLPKISNQKLNSYLKVISDLAGINQKITHHMARHTFATTICLNNSMPIEDLSKLLGHSSIKTTQIYGRITQYRLLESMEKIKRKI
jgi:integrase/recombinase XerD